MHMRVGGADARQGRVMAKKQPCEFLGCVDGQLSIRKAFCGFRKVPCPLCAANKRADEAEANFEVEKKKRQHYEHWYYLSNKNARQLWVNLQSTYERCEVVEASLAKAKQELLKLKEQAAYTLRQDGGKEVWTMSDESRENTQRATEPPK